MNQRFRKDGLEHFPLRVLTLSCCLGATDFATVASGWHLEANCYPCRVFSGYFRSFLSHLWSWKRFFFFDDGEEKAIDLCRARHKCAWTLESTSGSAWSVCLRVNQKATTNILLSPWQLLFPQQVEIVNIANKIIWLRRFYEHSEYRILN